MLQLMRLSLIVWVNGNWCFNSSIIIETFLLSKVKQIALASPLSNLSQVTVVALIFA
jgi:hypothetical protein